METDASVTLEALADHPAERDPSEIVSRLVRHAAATHIYVFPRSDTGSKYGKVSNTHLHETRRTRPRRHPFQDCRIPV